MLAAMIRGTLLLYCMLLATACTSMVMGGGQSAGVHEQHDGRSLQQVSEDADISRRVQKILTNYPGVDVHTANGIVVLQGTTASQRDIQRIISQVYRVDGVQCVESELRVASP